MLPFSYAWRNLGRRKVRTFMTVLGIALVTALFAAMSAVGATMSTAFQSTGESDEVVVTQAGALVVDFSSVQRRSLTYVQTLDGVAKSKAGVPLVSPEIYFTAEIHLGAERVEDLSVRGVRGISREVHRVWSLSRGQWPAGDRGVALGTVVARQLDLDIGDELQFEGVRWKVTGIYTTGGMIYDREIVVDLDELAATTGRTDFSNYVVRTTSAAAAHQLTELVNSQQRERIQAVTARAFYAQSGAMAAAMSGMGSALALIVALGAIFGGMNTMFSAVANRRREIGTLRALGYREGAIVVSLLLESVIVGMAGGLLGVLLASAIAIVPVDLPYVVGDSIQLSSTEAVSALGLALLVGIFGGLLPSLRAARMSAVEALR